jgi:hypothetical protein
MSSRRTTHRRGAALLTLPLLVAVAASASAGVRSDATASAAAAGHRPAAAEVRLVVTRDFGASVLVDTVAPWQKGMTVMRLLAEHATVDTGYGGQFVSSIDGLRSSFGSVSFVSASLTRQSKRSTRRAARSHRRRYLWTA